MSLHSIDAAMVHVNCIHAAGAVSFSGWCTRLVVLHLRRSVLGCARKPEQVLLASAVVLRRATSTCGAATCGTWCATWHLVGGTKQLVLPRPFGSHPAGWLAASQYCGLCQVSATLNAAVVLRTLVAMVCKFLCCWQSIRPLMRQHLHTAISCCCSSSLLLLLLSQCWTT